MPADPVSLQAFVIAAPGLEQVVATELEAIGVRGTIVGGGVEFDADLRTVYRANLELRAASRVLVRLGSFRVRALGELVRRAAALPWERFLSGGREQLDFRVTSKKSRLYHTGAIAERLAEGASARLGGEVRANATTEEDEEEGARQLVVVRLSQDDCTVSIDSSGLLLHKRGYREHGHRAPMRETLAAAMLMRAGYDGSVPLVDPMCGSGTIPIEGALIARQLAPGMNRQFAFEQWPEHRADWWKAMREDARTRARSRAPALIVAADRDEGAVQAALANAERGGVGESIQVRVSPLSAAKPVGEGSGVLATNPPYGVRLGDERALRDLYARFGQVVTERFAGWRIVMVAGSARLVAQTGLAWRELLRTRTGGLHIAVIERDASSPQSRVAKSGRPSRRSK